MSLLTLKGRRSFRETYLDQALGSGLIEMTLPDSYNSPTQKYRLTVAGRKLLSAMEGKSMNKRLHQKFAELHEMSSSISAKPEPAGLDVPVLSCSAVFNQENQHLIRIRDWLLPMLMNGQVSVV